MDHDDSFFYVLFWNLDIVYVNDLLICVWHSCLKWFHTLGYVVEYLPQPCWFVIKHSLDDTRFSHAQERKGNQEHSRPHTVPWTYNYTPQTRIKTVQLKIALELICEWITINPSICLKIFFFCPPSLCSSVNTEQCMTKVWWCWHSRSQHFTLARSFLKCISYRNICKRLWIWGKFFDLVYYLYILTYSINIMQNVIMPLSNKSCA